MPCTTPEMTRAAASLLGDVVVRAATMRNRLDPMHTSMCVRTPAGLPSLSRSHPSSPPHTSASASRSDISAHSMDNLPR